jgi:hypothetical protein
VFGGGDRGEGAAQAPRDRERRPQPGGKILIVRGDGGGEGPKGIKEATRSPRTDGASFGDRDCRVNLSFVVVHPLPRKTQDPFARGAS